MSDRKQNIRRALLVAGALVAVVFAWYVTGRLTSPSRAARTVNLAGAPDPGETPLNHLKIGTYNIAHGRGLADSNWVGRDRQAGLSRLQEIGRLLGEQKLDIIVLNEVDFGCTWSRGVNQAEVIARQAGLPHRAEGRNLDVLLPFLTFRFGNAVLSRFPIVEARVVDYPAYSRLEALAAGKKRGLLCTLELPRKERVRILAVHLEHRDEAVRVAAAKVIARLCSEGEPPLIAAGDFNSTPADYPCAERNARNQTALSLLLAGGRLTAALKEHPGREDFTFPSDKPCKAIDWVLVPTGWKISKQQALDSQLSDHRPVIADVVIGRTP